jgi:hypothetical protein
MMRHCICDAGCAKVQAMLEEMDLDPKLDMVPLLCRHAGAVWKPANALMSSVVCRFEFPHGPSCSQLLRMQRESWRSLSPGLRAMASLYERALFEKLYPMTGRLITVFVSGSRSSWTVFSQSRSCSHYGCAWKAADRDHGGDAFVDTGFDHKKHKRERERHAHER